ncbi:response regulator [Planctomycetales bacterium]|nr:response regulator [Planctomycetales bacterium]
MQKKTILIVDDNAIDLKLISHLLSVQFEPVKAGSGREALDYLAKHKPDLILLDVEMPEMSGLETLDEIKKMPGVADIPVIFFTALDGNFNELEGLEKGAVDYIAKPIIPELLRHRIAFQLELFDYRRHLEELVDQRTGQVLRLETVLTHTLANIAETRDTDTGAHIKRTCLYVELIGRSAMTNPLFADKIDEQFLTALVAAAPLHDIGKVGIPDHILNKPGKLTDEEFSIMQQHVAIGEKALRQAVEELNFKSYLDMALDVCATHHERWSGGGYLQGLSGEGIPLAGRIMSIADVYDALCAKRVYKDPMPHEKATDIIIQGAGTQFDPNLIEIFKQENAKFAEINAKYRD